MTLHDFNSFLEGFSVFQLGTERGADEMCKTCLKLKRSKDEVSASVRVRKGDCLVTRRLEWRNVWSKQSWQNQD